MSQHVVNITTQVDQTGLANLNATTQQHVDLLRQVAAQAKATQAATTAGTQAYDAAQAQIDAVNKVLASGSAQMVVQQTNLKNLAAALNAMGNTTGASAVTQQVAMLGKQLGQATGPIAAVKDSLLQFKSAYDGAGQGVNGLMAAMNAGLGTWLAWGYAAKQAAGYAKASVHEFSEAENALVKLDASLAQNGRLVGDASKKYQELATTLQDKTNVQATRWLGVMAQLNQRGANPENIERYSEAVAQLSTLMGGNIERAALMFGRAMDGSFMHFRRYGINVKEAGTNSEKLESAIRQIGERGAKGLEPQLQTVSGHFKALSNNMADLRENIGESVVAKLHLKEILYGLTQSVKWFNETLKDMRGWLETLPGPLRTILELLPFMPSALDKVKVANDAAALAADKASRMTELHAKALKEQKEAAEDAKKATDDYVTSIKEEAKAQNELLDAETKLKLAKIDADEKTGRIDKVEAARRRMNVKNESENKKFSIKQAELGGEIQGAKQELDEASNERSQYAAGVSGHEKRVQVARALQGLRGRGTDADIANVFRQAGLERDDSLLDADAVNLESKRLRDLEAEDKDGKKTREQKKKEDEARKKYNRLVKQYGTNQTARSLEAQATNLTDSVNFPQSQAQFSLEEKLKGEEFNRGESTRKLGGRMSQRDREEENRKLQASTLQEAIYKAQLAVQKEISGGSPQSQKVAAQALQLAVSQANQKASGLGFIDGKQVKFDLNNYIPQGTAGNMGGITPQGAGLVGRGTPYRMPTQNVPVIPQASVGPVTLGNVPAIPGQAAPAGQQIVLTPGQQPMTMPAGGQPVAFAPGGAPAPGQAAGFTTGQLGAGVPVPLPVIIVGVQGGGIPVTTGGGGGFPVIGGGGGPGVGGGGGTGGPGGGGGGGQPTSPTGSPSTGGGQSGGPGPGSPGGAPSSPNAPSGTTPPAEPGGGPGGGPKPGENTQAKDFRDALSSGFSEKAGQMVQVASGMSQNLKPGMTSALGKLAANTSVGKAAVQTFAQNHPWMNKAVQATGNFLGGLGGASSPSAASSVTQLAAKSQAALQGFLTGTAAAAPSVKTGLTAASLAQGGVNLLKKSGIGIVAGESIGSSLDWLLASDSEKTKRSDATYGMLEKGDFGGFFKRAFNAKQRGSNTYGFGDWSDPWQFGKNVLNIGSVATRGLGNLQNTVLETQYGWLNSGQRNDDRVAEYSRTSLKQSLIDGDWSAAVQKHGVGKLGELGLANVNGRVADAKSALKSQQAGQASDAAKAKATASEAERNKPFNERQVEIDSEKARFESIKDKLTPEQQSRFRIKIAQMARKLASDKTDADLRANGASEDFIKSDRASRAEGDDDVFFAALGGGTPKEGRETKEGEAILAQRAAQKKRQDDWLAFQERTKATNAARNAARKAKQPSQFAGTQAPDSEPVSEEERLAKLAAFADARAAGGPITGGRAYLVGEEGPELVVPSQSGTVVSADDTQAALERAGNSIGSSGAQMAGAVGGLARLVVQSNGATIAVVAEMAVTIQQQAGQLNELREYVKNQR